MSFSEAFHHLSIVLEQFEELMELLNILEQLDLNLFMAIFIVKFGWVDTKIQINLFANFIAKNSKEKGFH